ncbi:IL-1 beta-receptor [Eptesipox virus]|uniref:Soluble interferon alpha/beta receptor OPG204 n=1 Tax=Eptesipox virus TaxID=1329402 RepID=A0A220T6M6_9POXV|nr:IL-1 beta-receptor [Eptesipox virus]ASK51368.1 IL-1 beta-receptor [Eptesipox virus]WAH71126.1 IL-1 beta-receptor [Eptesipox virus]
MWWYIITLISVSYAQIHNPFNKNCTEKRILPGDITYNNELYHIQCPQIEFKRRSIFKNNNNYTLTWVKTLNYDIVFDWHYYTQIYFNDKNKPIHVNNKNLIFAPISVADTGTYVCFLQNATECEYGTVIVTAENRKYYIDDNIVSMEGNTVELYCDSNSISVPEAKNNIIWLRHEKKIKNANNVKLILTNITKNDMGLYICKVETTYNKKVYNSFRYINLYVKPKSKIQAEIISPMGNIKAKVNSTIEINCTINTNELVKYAKYRLYWKINNKLPFMFSTKGIKEKSESLITDKIVNLPLEIFTNNDVFTYNFTCYYDDLDYKEQLHKTIKLIKI